MEDVEILRLIVKKDFAGLDGLIDCYGDNIIKTIRSILPKSYEQNYWEDVENEVFYSLWQKVPLYDERRSSLITFILMITRNIAIDYKRKLVRQLQETAFPEQDTIADFDETEPLAKEAFLELIDQLSELDQRIFLYYYFYQETPEQIANLTSLATSAVYNHLSRGKTKLRAELIVERRNHHGL